MSDLVQRRVKIILENLNADVKEAAKDGLTKFEITAMIGSISEDLLRSLPKDIRKPAWDVVVGIMALHFDHGEI